MDAARELVMLEDAYYVVLAFAVIAWIAVGKILWDIWKDK